MNVLLSPLAAGALGVLVELSARWWLHHRGVYCRYVPHTRQRHVIDREALPALPPVTHMVINREGERGGPPPRPGERCFRALVVGGSAAECYFLDQEQTWPAVVQRILLQPEHLASLGAERVHVGNVARAIIPCADLNFMLKKMLPRYHSLDAVLIMVGASDLIRWMEGGIPQRISEASPRLSKIFEEHPEGPWGWKPKQWAFRHILARLNRRFRSGELTIEHVGSWMHHVRATRAAATPHRDDVPDATPMLDRFGSDLEALLETARTKTKRVILVRQPWLSPNLSPAEECILWNFGLGRPYCENVTTYFTFRVVDALMQQVDDRARAVAERLGVEQVNLSPRLDRSTRTFYDELHFTPEGAEAVGRLVASAVLSPSAYAASIVSSNALPPSELSHAPMMAG